jgi:hypothetical protein
MQVELTRLLGGADELDPTRPVDEVEEDELPQVPSSHHPAGQAALGVAGPTRLELLGLGPDCRDLVPIGKALSRGHGRRV